MSSGEATCRPVKRRKTLTNSEPDDMAASPSDAHMNAPLAVSLAADEPASAAIEESTSATTTNVLLSTSLETSAEADVEDVPTRTVESDTTKPEKSCVTWPAQKIPIEIFNFIVRYLPRKDIKTMRLVNKEFDAKLAEEFFHTVVVRFRPEFKAMYGCLKVTRAHSGDQHRPNLRLKSNKEESAPSGDLSKPAEDDSLLSDGHRVFHEFGKQMRKFALALELNENDLAYPPLKITQEIKVTPWGLYRWPIMSYQRYTKLQGLEQLADETGSMKDAFRFLTDIAEIGLSCDAGLGWLQGPDTNRYGNHSELSVFRPMEHSSAANSDQAVTPNEDQASVGLAVLKQMALNAGFLTHDWHTAILRLLEDECREGAVQWTNRDEWPGNNVTIPVPMLTVDETTTKEDIIRHIESVITNETDLPTMQTVFEQQTQGLHPASLTTAQAEMLLELEWAHRALIQSFRIAVLDNKANFNNLAKLKIARLSACHVLAWCNRPFWDSMTSIKTFHLGVIPDWRVVSKDATGAVTQQLEPPINSYAIVFRLLHEFVGVQENIKNLSFEWISGGELAMGKAQRDRYIMPAPVISNALYMVNVWHSFAVGDMLHLPHVSALTLKNCWFSPQVFLNFFKHLSLDALVEVQLESVSLTGPATNLMVPSVYPTGVGRPAHWPWPLCAGAEPGQHFQLVHPGQPFHQQPPLATLVGIGLGILNPANVAHNLTTFHAAVHNLGATGVASNNTSPGTQPMFLPTDANMWRLWSWPHVLASLGMVTPSVKEHLEDVENDAWRTVKQGEKRLSSQFESILRMRDNKQNHQSIKLKSCGYVLVNSSHIDNWRIIPEHRVRVRYSDAFVERLQELDVLMLNSSDGMLGKTLNYMSDVEQMVLRTRFGFSFGWDGVYHPDTIRAAMEDGNAQPGLGRFTGETTNDPDALAVKEKSMPDVMSFNP